jgi:thioredoxin 1
MSSAILTVDDSNFEQEVLKATIPVLVKFGATWCAPCAKQTPILEQLGRENQNIKIVTVDIDESSTITRLMKIKSVPTLALFNNGDLVDCRIGLMTLADLRKMIETKC